MSYDLPIKRCFDLDDHSEHSWEFKGEPHVCKGMPVVRDACGIDDYVAYCRYTDRGSIVTCDSDAPKAFKVYRQQEALQTDFETWADKKGITETVRWWAREAWNEAIRQR